MSPSDPPRTLPQLSPRRLLEAAGLRGDLEQMTRAAYLVDGVRTPIGRYSGGLAAVRADLTGIDIGYHVKQQRYADTNDPADLPSRSVVDLFEAGRLGRKTGRGWYTYDTAGA